MRLEYPKLKQIVAATAVFSLFFLTFPLSPAAQEADLPAAQEPDMPAAQEADLSDETELLSALALADPAQAKRFERQLLALWSNSGSAAMDLLLKRGRDALEKSDSRAAIEHLTALVDHAPDFAEGWYARATAYFQAGLYGPALADLERALALNPNNYNAIIGLATMFETFGDPARAYEAYLRAQAIHPNNQDIGDALARLKPDIEGEAL